MKAINFKNITIKGELAVRCGKNFVRLEDEWYRPDEVYKADGHGWPGDWEGRTILALSLHSQLSKRRAAYLDEMVSLLPNYLNAKGHLGPILRDGLFDEQHFAGHSWLIRGLIEYYKLTGYEYIKKIVEKMLSEYILPVKGSFPKYPITMEERAIANDVGIWHLSQLQTKLLTHAGTSDAGCVFILLDGLTDAFDFLGWPELKELIEEMIQRFSEMDLLGCYIQTHATLSGTRGVIRFYENVKEKKYLDLAERMFKLYKSEAMSEAYGNYNWFGLPQRTEPCAIIDSFMVAVQLWKNTGKKEYLEDAHLIFYNAMLHANRYSGAFGSDNCPGAINGEDILYFHPKTFDIYWCCNMRGGEGLTRASQYSIFTDSNTAYFPFYNDCAAELEFEQGILKIDETSRYPFYGDVTINIVESTISSPVKLKFFVPSWTDDVKIILNDEVITHSVENGFITLSKQFKKGDIIKIDLGLSLRFENSISKNSIDGHHKFFFGALLLGHKTMVEFDQLGKIKLSENIEAFNLPKDIEFERVDKSVFKHKQTGMMLTALCDVKDMTKEETCRQVMFK